MTPDEKKSALVHIENALRECRACCAHPHGIERVTSAYIKTIELGNALFKDMNEYRRSFSDPTG